MDTLQLTQTKKKPKVCSFIFEFWSNVLMGITQYMGTGHILWWICSGVVCYHFCDLKLFLLFWTRFKLNFQTNECAENLWIHILCICKSLSFRKRIKSKSESIYHIFGILSSDSSNERFYYKAGEKYYWNLSRVHLWCLWLSNFEYVEKKSCSLKIVNLFQNEVWNAVLVSIYYYLDM